MTQLAIGIRFFLCQHPLQFAATIPHTACSGHAQLHFRCPAVAWRCRLACWWHVRMAQIVHTTCVYDASSAYHAFSRCIRRPSLIRAWPSSLSKHPNTLYPGVARGGWAGWLAARYWRLLWLAGAPVLVMSGRLPVLAVATAGRRSDVSRGRCWLGLAGALCWPWSWIAGGLVLVDAPVLATLRYWCGGWSVAWC